MKEKRVQGYLYAVAAAMCFSLFSVLGKLFMTRGATPGVVLFWQYPATMLGIVGYFFVKKTPGLKIEKKKYPLYLLAGILAIGANLSFYHAMDYVGASLTTLLFYSSPVFTALFFSLSGIRKISAFNWLAIVLALFGSSLTLEVFSGVGALHPVGVLLALLAGLVYSLYSILLDLKLFDQNFHNINFYSCCLGFIVINLLNSSSGINPLNLPWKEIIGLFAIGLFSGLVPNYLNFKSITSIGSEKSSVVLSLELPATLIFAYFLLGESMKLPQLVGVALVFLAVILLSQGDRGQENPK